MRSRQHRSAAALVALLLLSWLLAAAGGARTDAATADAAYSDPNGFWSVRYPAAWVTRTAGSEQQFLTDDSGSAGFAVSVRIKAVTAPAMVAEVAQLLAGKLDGYTEEDRGDAEIDGLPAAFVEHTYRVDGEEIAGIVVGTVRNRVGILVVGWAPERDKEPVQDAFESFVSSLRVPRFDEAPPYAEWVAKRTTHFRYRYLPDTYVASAIAAVAKQHEGAYASIVKVLGVKPTGAITMWFYPSEESLYRATARDSGFAITEASEVHTVWVSARDHQSLGHEMTHVITAATMGEPSEALLGEGIAVCLDQATPAPRARAAALLADDRLVPLTDLLGDAYFDVDASVRYPQSGSVACWLVQTYGAAKFKQLYAAPDFAAALRSLYKLDVAGLEQRWLASLEG